MKSSRHRSLLLLPLALILVSSTVGQAVAAESKYVELTLDFGDGFQKRYTEISPRVDFTVIGVLEAAERHAQGIAVEYRGSGGTAFVESIDEVANQEGGAAAKNWRYYYNGALAKQGAGAQPVKAGDRILWKFESGD